jgi:sec-independent protein translocase protein TatC
MPDEDYFDGTKMTFGEHLEELRVALFRSLIGLVLGLLIGLYLASYVVEFIKGPLQRSLETYYVSKTIDRLRADYGVLPQELEEFVVREKLIFEKAMFERAQLGRIQVNAHPSGKEATAKFSSGSDDAMGTPTTDMVSIRLWKPVSAQVKSLNAYEVFMIWLKAATITGAIIASPWIFFQIWSFIAAGLYPHEKDKVYIFLPISLALFFGGAALAFFFVFEPVLKFLFEFNKSMNIDVEPRISEWMGFVLLLPLAFGISFQLPLLMLLLNRIGILSVKMYIEKWRISVLVIFVIAMFLTPADPVSMLLMGIPLTLLYFLGIAMCRWMPGVRKSPFGLGYDP